MIWYFFENIVLDEYEDKIENIDVKYSKVCIVFFFVFFLVLMCFIYGCIFYIFCKYIESDCRLSVFF